MKKFPVSPAALAGKSDMSSVFMRHSACKDKTQLKLSIGDPTFDGNLKTTDVALNAFAKNVGIATRYSYQRAWGLPAACKAVAEWWADNFATENREAVKAENVILTTGGAEAIVNSITALCDEGDNILTPAPGFPAYAFCCDTFGIKNRFYHQLPNKNWELDLNEIRRLVDDRTRAIVLNNPSNPSGSNWSRQHVEEIVRLCEELKLPIISDEIYCGMVFTGQVFTSVAQFKSQVPRFIICSLAKNFMVPGWRTGWVLLIDEAGYAASVLKGMQNLAMHTLGPNAIAQHALPEILKDTPKDYFHRNIAELETNAKLFVEELRKCHGLSCAEPQGALYVMVKVHFDQFKDFMNDVEFYEALEDEENVQVVPGTYLFMPGFFRVCFVRERKVIEEVMKRLAAFCDRHRN
ncbi:putative tyrosine aminotransferase putative L-tyrosine:2-oxoglutarate aminotransferase [Leptomonas seymouri]|uniref:Putative tyrosine aminotransferase putative L-tyrosine:2-oxoglutarate aminotransferase n=1 Tax=Leptomonas seymouri TaxID=5684 RepID=A0A0N0P7P4_LEPSE|nr:putative tyrosine aminotransferase putative L-tyrosine:2-oxoglutarate aminotransferase [Leptomonas seymouri]|eukprot:KPI88597.1 putative tyrosine aminotransferase putative L-tyrosine:2-oxoglutarate aminotransferase [Leptomonas seymouri]